MFTRNRRSIEHFTFTRFAGLTRSGLARSVFTKAISICIWLAIGSSVASPAIADEVSGDAVPQNIFNLDLCTLAYQFYHQSLCLPLDPWYDVMSRVGSDRRTNICKFTHEYSTSLGPQGFYSGPNSARSWRDSNTNLDPILSNYKQIDSNVPTFNRDGAVFLAVLAPDYVTKNIRAIDGVRYKSKPTSLLYNDLELFQIRQNPSGTDHLVVFEGGTGRAGTTEPSWSLMGFVLMRKTPTGYDAHIVFRGSRSGASLSKTLWRAQDAIGEHKGNPDWITDLRGTKQIEQPIISKVGKVTEGFAESLPTMLGTVTGCCKYLAQNYPAPEHIYVTGHSLGAGLASQFVSAVKQGSFGDSIRQEVKTWPWDKATLMAYAQPIPGDTAWAANFDKLSPTSEHYWVTGDFVVEGTSNAVVGLFIDKGEHSGIQKKLSLIAGCNDNPHEVFVIRASLLRDLASSNADLSQKLASENTWAYYDSFSKMLEGQAKSYVYPGAPAPKIVTEANLRRILNNCNFSSEFSRWLQQVYARMIADKSSYIGFKLQSTLDERQKLVGDIVNRISMPPFNDNAKELDELVNDFQLLDGNLGLTNEEQWIYCGMILARIQNTSLTLQDLLSKSVIKTCMESKFE